MGMNVMETIKRFLTASLKSDDAKLARAELLVVLVPILMIVLFVMDAYRLCSNSRFVRTVPILETVTSPLVTYTIGLLQNLTFSKEQLTSQFFGIWGVLLYILQSGTEHITAYSITYQHFGLRDLVLTCFAGNLNATKGSQFQLFLWVLWSLGPIMIVYKIVSLEVARHSYSHGRNSKLLVEYMKSECQKNQQIEPNPITMNGYQYIVRGENEQEIVAHKVPTYQVGMNITNKRKFITLESVWNCDGHLLVSLDSELILKDVCLSYALHKLLCCEMVDLFLPRECRYKTYKLLFEGVLKEAYSDKRIFRIMEMEIAFLNDYSYTRLPIGVWYGYPLIKFVTLLVTLCIVGQLAYDVHLTRHDQDYYFYHTIMGQNIDRFITYVLLVLIVLKEMWEMFLYIFSDWTKLVIICQYVEGLWLLRNRLVEHIILLLCRLNLVMRWHNKMAQYILLESFNYTSWVKKILYYGTLYMVKKPIEGGKVGKTIKIFDEVKSSTVQALRLITINGDDIRNGMPCLYKRRVRAHYQWAFRQETCSHLILVWHIATSMCEIQLSEELGLDKTRWNTLLRKLKIFWSHQNPFLVDLERLEGRTRANYIVANSISRYCAYLLVSVPELLPDHEVVSKSVFKGTVSDAQSILGDCDSLESVLLELKRVGSGHGPESHQRRTIVYRGAKLGTELLADEQTNMEARWEMLADFWVDMLLYLSPSNMTEDHRYHLIEGGEFITLIWALFTNCGVFDQTAEEEHVSADDEPGTTDVEGGQRNTK